MNYNERTVHLSNSNQKVLKRSLEVFCGKWRLFIIFQLSEQDRRYGELRRMIPDISEKVLIQELKSLVALGVLQKTVYNETPPRVEYGLTERSIEILPILVKIREVGEAFLEP